MRDDSSDEDLRYVLELFEALAEHFDQTLTLNAADGADPEIAARLGTARALAVRGSAKVREHLDPNSATERRAAGK